MARILVVDNHPVVLQSMKVFLEAAGHVVVTSGGAREGLRKARRQRPELALIDYELEDMSGAAACKAIQADPSLCGMPVLLVTGGILHEVEPVALAAGAKGVIVKPFTMEQLQNEVARHLGT